MIPSTLQLTNCKKGLRGWGGSDHWYQKMWEVKKVHKSLRKKVHKVHDVHTVHQLRFIYKVHEAEAERELNKFK